MWRWSSNSSEIMLCLLPPPIPGAGLKAVYKVPWISEGVDGTHQGIPAWEVQAVPQPKLLPRCYRSGTTDECYLSDLSKVHKVWFDPPNKFLITTVDGIRKVWLHTAYSFNHFFFFLIETQISAEAKEHSNVMTSSCPGVENRMYYLATPSYL